MRKKIIEFLIKHPNFAYKHKTFLSDLSVEEWECIVVSQPLLKKEALQYVNGMVLFAETFSDLQLEVFEFDHWDILVKRNRLREKAKKYPIGAFALYINGYERIAPQGYIEISKKSWCKILSDESKADVLSRNPQIIEMCNCWFEMEDFCDRIMAVHPELWRKFRKSSVEKILEDSGNFKKSESVGRFTKPEWFKIIEKWPHLAEKCPREIFLRFDKLQWNKLNKAQNASIDDMHLKSMLFNL